MGLINNKLALLMGTTVAITSTLLTNTKVKADTDANSSSKEVTVQNDNQSTNSINTQKVTLQNQSTKNEDSSVDTKSVVSNTETSNDQSSTGEANVTSTTAQNSVESSSTNSYADTSKTLQVSDASRQNVNESTQALTMSRRMKASVKLVSQSYKTGWVNTNNNWSYYQQGKKVTGWLQGGNDWYYFDQNGKMATSWLQGGNDWYYFNPVSGHMQTKWLKNNNKWYYLNPTSGRMQKGWLQGGNDWYYFDRASGDMKTSWLQGGNDWYYFNSSSGRMQKGWLDEKGDWYYFKNNGMMATGYYNGYLFSNSGKWISNFTLTGLGAKDFISQIGEVAKIVADEYGIYASMMIAQAGLESGWGSSMLSQQAHNLFGVKWSGKGNYVTMPTLEYYGGAYHTVNAPFAAYNTYYESLVGYATMIKTRFPKSTKSYSPTYQDAARNLRNGIYGTYATDPYYASKLISVINTYGLYKYDI
ncbi:glucosaminidase domain-containing protein [Ligilactobacillus salivarius]|uniref:glucosaminidase domain-containing protein n=1 Tax=Ligilactobacillus salivarius TaxID=1624 RepID=UPI001367F988|nr:glucosaminidase domain-containing protein [Ligilactobacillus salivarius]MYZ71930.1 hypothetical protein [Ligilactobacillus salivarius]